MVNFNRKINPNVRKSKMFLGKNVRKAKMFLGENVRKAKMFTTLREPGERVGLGRGGC